LLVVNCLVVAVAAFALLYGVWIGELASSIATVYAITMTAYSVFGLMLLILVGFVWVEMGPVRESSSSRLIITAIVVYAAGLCFWPLWRLSSEAHVSALWAEIVLDVLLLTAYLLVFLAGVHRIENATADWLRTPAVSYRFPVPWVDMTVSAMATVVVLASGWGAYQAGRLSPGRDVYLGVLIASTLLAVCRTVLAAHLDERLGTRLITDEVTGTQNARGLDARVAVYLASATRFGESFVLIIAAADRFSHLGDRLGPELGDEALARVASVLTEGLEGTGQVFSLLGDRFAILAPIADSSEAGRLASRARSLVRSVVVAGRGLECSVGFALCPDDAIVQDALVLRAEQALAWAQSHGGGQIVRHDDHIERAIGMNARTNTLERSSRLDMVRALSAAADARDRSNTAHSRQVAALSRSLAERLGFDEEHSERVQIAALLHDVGKIALARDGHPDRSRYFPRDETVGQHAQLGARMLESLGAEDIPVWVLHHHERWDGQGCPSGVAGDMIPIEARIIAIANHFDRRISGALHGSPMSKLAVLQDIDLGIGTLFDPALAEMFIEMIASSQGFGWAGWGHDS
jgi:diguanylate cyclase (GGDEF)-like protein/putative nucleotidyltransferase with HDIG domain